MISLRAPRFGDLVALAAIGVLLCLLHFLAIDMLTTRLGALSARQAATEIKVDRVRMGQWQIQLDLTTGKGVISLPAETEPK